MKKNFIYAFVLLTGVLAACTPVKTVVPEFPVKDKTILVYMVGNNNLSSDAANNMDGIKNGYVPENDNLLVYYHTQEQTPVLIKVFKDGNGAVAEDTVYRFPDRNSSTAESLKSAMQVTGTMFPAEEYGLFLWSHGTGWLPEGHYNTKSFGSENGKEIEIQDLVNAFPYKLSFVLFDACLMGSVEVAYQLKDSVDYIISSPAEILSSGFPYSKIMGHIFRTPMDLESVAREYFEFYNFQNGQFRSATVSLVKTEALDNLAGEVKAVFEKYRDNIGNLDSDDVQPYFRYNKNWFYDLGDFVRVLASEEDALPVLQALDKAVIYKAATPAFLDIQIDPEKFSGLSTYIPIAPADTLLNEYYRTLEWNKAVGMIK